MTDPQSDPTSSTAASLGLRLEEQLAQDLKEDRLELPGFPEAVLRVQRALQSPDTSADDVVKILSSEPALAAQALRIANSVQFRRRDGEITDLRMAVNRLGFNLVRSVSVAFAIRQLRLRHGYTAAVRAEIESAWRDSIKVASVCYVIAKHCTQLNADQALLAGLLHVVGRLYVAVRAAAFDGFEDAVALEQLKGWRAAVGKAILEGWGLPEALQHAVEHQDDVDYVSDDVSLTTVLIAAKLLADGSADAACPALERIAAAKSKDPAAILTERADELRELRSSLGE